MSYRPHCSFRYTRAGILLPPSGRQVFHTLFPGNYD
uniref:Uncharacterized protein n=1 Tax=Anguilla anguilla TaxID=7936 RepID=A0A0E9PW96_ANGAN